jgi:hypothetical protein
MYHVLLISLRPAETPLESDANIVMSGKCDVSLIVSDSAVDHIDRLGLSRVQDMPGSNRQEGHQPHPAALRFSWEL